MIPYEYDGAYHFFGGPGSGHWGHAGRKGKRGGSVPRSGGFSTETISSYEKLYGNTTPALWDFDPEWGMSPGTYTGYRGTKHHGSVSSSGITYFSPEPTSAAVYNENVKPYKLEVRNPLVVDTKNDLVKKLFGKSFQDMLYSIDKKVGDTSEANRILERRIAKKLKTGGYDSVLVQRSQPPSVREIGIVGDTFSLLMEDSSLALREQQQTLHKLMAQFPDAATLCQFLIEGDYHFRTDGTKVVLLGGPGSGHHRHKGIPGHRGGSLPKTVQASGPIVDAALDSFYGRNEDLDEICELGYATCPGGAYGAARAIHSIDKSVRVVGGEFDEQSHYWAEVGDLIVDLGNNIDAAERNEEIRPIIVPKSSKFGKRYSNRDEEYTTLEFLRQFKNDPMAKPSMDIFRRRLSELAILGGPGSGNYGHAGRPGKRGGSLPRNVAMSITTGYGWRSRQIRAKRRGRIGEEVDDIRLALIERDKEIDAKIALLDSDIATTDTLFSHNFNQSVRASTELGNLARGFPELYPGQKDHLTKVSEESLSKAREYEQELNKLKEKKAELQAEQSGLVHEMFGIEHPLGAQIDSALAPLFSKDQIPKIEKGFDNFNSMVEDRAALGTKDGFWRQVYVGVSDTGRSYYDARSLRLTPGSGESATIHELGHWLEEMDPKAHQAATGFLKYRTAGEKSIPLDVLEPYKHYRSDELSRPDRFLEPYIGKIYQDGKSTEIISMGLEWLDKAPARLAQRDSEHFALMYGIARNDYSSPFMQDMLKRGG